ncbi:MULTISPECIES: Lrp/AsnC family transcriptional regulator [unclassified Brevibacterium]|uniref:Lrp/AsnC family transcriptional regulator n=1 Tax=unclassified Brevibacterium TaxID=2614124 RepID=UPI00362D8238
MKDVGAVSEDVHKGPEQLDELDRKLISALQVDGRTSFSVLAERFGVPASSVRYRVQRLQDSGMFQIVGIANPLNIGFDRLAMIGIRCQAGKGPEVCEKLSALPETSYVILTSGSFDVMVEVVCRDIDHYTELMFERLQKIPGVEATESFFVLKAHKLAYGWGVGEA